LYRKIIWMIGVALLPISLMANQDSLRVIDFLSKGDSLLKSEDYKAAADAYKSVLKKNKKSVPALAGMGKIAVAKEDWGEAKSWFDKIVDIDEAYLEAHYYRGICSRETGKSKVLVQRMWDWDRAQKHFEHILQRDSSFQDVLYQYAQLQRYREHYEQAVLLGQAQVRIRPDLVLPQVQLFRLYRYLIANKDEQHALAWLKQQPGEHARYFIGEKLRREGKMEQADSVFQDLLAHIRTMPKQPLYLSLAKINYEKNFLQTADRYYWQAVAEIQNEVDAELVFEDLKYLLKDDELEDYQSRQTIAAKIDFFRKFWAQRDPMPATTHNMRLAEHYHRLCYAEKFYEFDGFRINFNNPDKMNYLQFTKAYHLNNEFNDKGLIYLRHGPPDDKIITAGLSVASNESWKYFKNQEYQEMTFHFVLENTVSNWRMAPFLTDPYMLDDRLQWGTIYGNLLYANKFDFYNYLEEMANVSRESVKQGLASDRHSWGREVVPLDLYFTTATFRGEQDKTIVEVYYSVPVLSITNGDTVRENEVAMMEHGLAVHDLAWNPIFTEYDSVAVPLTSGKVFVDAYRCVVPPDSYHFALHVHPKGSNLFGGYKFEQKIENYSAPQLAMSDLQLAHQIDHAFKKHKFVKNNLLIIPNPSLQFERDKIVYLYFEIYNLTPDAEGKTNFALEYSLIQMQAKERSGMNKLWQRLFGKKKTSVTVRTDREGKDATSIEHLAIDISRYEPGDYELKVKVIDQNSDNRVERKSDLALF